MDVPDLALVVAVDETGSLTGASTRLHVAQPALSRRLASLERQVGGPLFVRGRHGAVATAAGRVLAARAADALAAVDRAEREVRDAIEGRAGRLRVGTTPTLGADLLPMVLAAARAEHPEVSFDLVTRGDSGWLGDEVRAGRLDVAVAVVEDDPRPGIRAATTGRQPFVLVLPADHPLARRRRVPRASLLGEPFVALALGEGLRVQLDAVFAELGAEPTVSIETTEREMLVPLVTAGLGVCLLPEVFARQRAGAGVEVRPLDPPLARRVGALVRDEPAGGLLDVFVDALRTHGWQR